MTQSSVTLQVGVNQVGILNCAAFSGNVSLSSIITLKQGGTAVPCFSPRIMSISIAHLVSSTIYSVFCYLEGYDGYGMSLDSVQQTRTVFVTTCCRRLQFTAFFPFIPELTSTAKLRPENTIIYSLSMDAPSNFVTVIIMLAPFTCEWSTSDVPARAAANPSIFRFSPESTDLTGTFIISGSPGCYDLILSPSDTTAYQPLTKAVVVYSTSSAPPAPSLVSATFSNDGLQLSIVFSASTNKGNIPSPFSCDKLLSFPGSSLAACRWSTTTVIVATLPLFTQFPDVAVGTNVSLLDSVITANCPAEMVCDSAFSATVAVAPPVDPIIPTVELSSSPVVGGCTDVVLDPTGSRGQAGREWVKVTWTVFGPGARNIFVFLNEHGTDTSRQITIPRNLFSAGNYVINLSLKNFLLQSSTNFAAFTVSSSVSVPQLTIAGSKTIFRLRWQPVSLIATGSLSTCLQLNESVYPMFSWTIFDDSNQKLAFRSTSMNPRFFQLPTFTLKSSAIYVVQVSIYSSTAVRSILGNSSVTVVVGSSGIQASIVGAMALDVGFLDTIMIDASSSHDIDYPMAPLNFTWTCLELFPARGTPCSIVSYNQPTLSILATELLAGAGLTADQEPVFTITVRVSNSHGASTANAQVVVKNVASLPQILMGLVELRYNPGAKLILTGSVRTDDPAILFWTSPDVHLARVALTPVQMTLNRGAALFQLGIAAGSLLSGMTYTLVLGASVSSSVPNSITKLWYQSSSTVATSSIQIEMNSAPSGGNLAVRVVHQC